MAKKGQKWNMLRHIFASRLVNRGVDIVTVMELLEHSMITAMMRLRPYEHSQQAGRSAKSGVQLLQFGYNAPEKASKVANCSRTSIIFSAI